MSLVLEITCTNLKLGNSGSKVADIFQVNYRGTASRAQLPPQFELDDHALGVDDRARLVEQLRPEYATLSSECQTKQGTWLPLREAQLTKQLLRKIIYKALFQKSYSSKRVFIVDHDYSEKMKGIIYEIFKELKAKSVVFLPWSVLAVLGADQRNGLVLNFTMETLKVQVVVDLRVIYTTEEVTINCLNKHEKHSEIGQIIENTVKGSAIDLRKCLGENVIIVGDEGNDNHDIDLTLEKEAFETRLNVGCWAACSLYSQISTTWQDYKPYHE
ncbi:uncharacterized protein LODBEIA_P57650 [Lodderomyces beijingensis]|uniref:Uncharacterized protein n=1 Tax=Lodderomyces beijingensis TaxID=1775926 RepID=A0ABP0ZVU3_9ASCO